MRNERMKIRKGMYRRLFIEKYGDRTAVNINVNHPRLSPRVLTSVAV